MWGLAIRLRAGLRGDHSAGLPGDDVAPGAHLVVVLGLTLRTLPGRPGHRRADQPLGSAFALWSNTELTPGSCPARAAGDTP